MADIWNLINLHKAEEFFDQQTTEAKLLCAIIANCNIDFDSSHLQWLLHDFHKRGLCENLLDETQMSDMLSDLVKKGLLKENRNRYMVADIYYPAAYRFPLYTEAEKFALSLHSYSKSSDYSFEFNCKQNYFSSILMNLLCNNISEDILENFDYDFLGTEFKNPILSKTLEPFDEDWFDVLPETSQIFLFNYAVYYELLTFRKIINADDEYTIFKYFMKAKWYKSELFLKYGAHNLALYLILQGNFDRAKSYLDVSTSFEADGLNAFIVYLFHGCNEALGYFHEAMKKLQREKSKRNITFFSIADVFYFISLLQDGSSSSLYEASKHIEKIDKIPHIFKPVYQLLSEFYCSRTMGKINDAKINTLLSGNHVPFINWLGSFVALWTGLLTNNKCEAPVKELISLLEKTDLKLPLVEMYILARKLNIRLNSNQEAAIEEWRSKFVIPFVDRVDQKQKWEFVLDEIASKLNLKSDSLDTSIRLIWDLRLNIEEHSIKLTPKEQTKLKNGNWSVGKPVPLDAYFEDITPFPNFYSEQDKQIYKSLQKNRPWISGSINSGWSILPELIACPKVYLNENLLKPIEVVKGTPVLMLCENAEGLYFTFMPEYVDNNIIAVKENEDRLRIYEFSNNQIQMAQILSEQKTFPMAALPRLKEIISGLNSLMPVHSTLEDTDTLAPIATICSSSLIYAQLEPIGDGLRVSFCVKPFGIKGPTFAPGKGESNVFTEIAGQNLHTIRNLECEKKNYDKAIMSCPLLIGALNDECSALFDTLEGSLDLLLNLKDIEDLIVEWPQNAKKKRVKSALFNGFNFTVKRNGDWFTLNGELKIDENHVIDLQKILSNFEKGNRFIQIGEDEYLAITEEFRKRIEDIKTFTNSDDKQSIFHISSIRVMDEILNKGGQLTFDRAWHEMLNNIKHAESKTFEVPKEFKAELREYQEEGFKWLSRMSLLGMGSCLADDMGLGKTVEALSIITSRIDLGPAFVLAPTSVCSNWYNECKRFAPTLNPILFAQSDRKQVMKDLKPGDLIICSYGVLQREIDDLTSVDWSVVVLDEAQAIKNMATNRSQAAMLLRGKFKMLMTGTPIENHLGELWNLFKFLNPGLLGDLKTFNDKFAVPIQSFNDKGAQERLKRLVQPFILRRTKNQVLKDLPPRTEVTLNVDLSQDEADLYESIRRNALEHIKNDGNREAKPMIVLAEIMKLRRLCCNPSLVFPDRKIKSSKLELLKNILADLKAGGHKALIFSQFVEHLQIIRKYMDEANYNYKYFDGSTTIKNRDKAIKEFQDGEGDFFLISLKAGGQGINLTAADYVIHMDPWWNPAVEDQASDRAHRIGQTKPVTIYKLVTTNTIEEKIIQLHSKKRDLADGLLDGTDITGRLTTSELIALLTNTVVSR